MRLRGPEAWAEDWGGGDVGGLWKVPRGNGPCGWGGYWGAEEDGRGVLGGGGGDGVREPGIAVIN